MTQILRSYLFLVMWLAYIVYWRAMAANVKETQRRESDWSRVPRQILLICAVLLLALPRIPFAFLNARFLPLGDWSFWTGVARHCHRIAFFCLGAQAPGRKLEPGGYTQTRSRTHHQRTLCAGSSPDLHRTPARASRFCHRPRRMAGTAGCRHSFRRAVAKTEA